jgi:hypothetical protein
MFYAFVAFTGATHSQGHYSAQEIHRRIAAARHLNQPPPLYKEKTFGHCDANGDGWTTVTSVAACEAGAVALGWGDTTADTTLLSNKPSWCYRNYATLNFNPDNSNGVACDWNQKCLCTFVCPPGSYQDPLGEALCTTCSNGTYSTAGASSCPFDATSCPRGTYASGSTTVCNAKPPKPFKSTKPPKPLLANTAIRGNTKTKRGNNPAKPVQVVLIQILTVPRFVLACTSN